MADLIDRAAVLEICTRFPYPEGIANAVAALPAQGVKEDIDALAYRFWSIHPKDIPEAVGMPEGYKGGKRAWFYANEMRRILAALEPAEAGGVEEPISDARLESEALCARFLAGETSEKEVVDTIKRIALANERLAVLLGQAKAAPRYSVSAEWAEKMLTADDGVTPAAGTIDGEAAMHIETALAMARVQDGYARKATGEGERMIFAANAPAEQPVATSEAGGVEAHPYSLRPDLQRIVENAKTAPQWDTERDRFAPAPADALVKAAEFDSFYELVLSAIEEAARAMRKFPQPNYVISKVAEEAGEVVKAAIHCAENRETAENVRGEMRQLIAMLYRLWVEGDQVHGLAAIRGEQA